MASKTRLKEIREAIASKDFRSAKLNAEKVLDFDPTNYNANVFLGLANLELGLFVESEKAYIAATEVNPSQSLAWQGLSQFYERTSNNEKLKSTLLHLAYLWNDDETSSKCLDTLKKLIDISRKDGSESESLQHLLPGGPFSQILPAADTLKYLLYLIEVVEKKESESFNKEIARRRTRLDASRLSRDQLDREVGWPIWTNSKLPSLYNEAFAHPNAEERLRRDVEVKLLQYQYRQLLAVPPNAQDKHGDLSSAIIKLVDGMILLKLPIPMAWTIHLNTRDFLSIDEYNCIFVDMQQVLPDSLDVRLNKVKGDLDFVIQEKGSGVESTLNLYDNILEHVSGAKTSIYALRVISDVHVKMGSFGEAISVSELCLSLLKKWEDDFGTRYFKTREGLQLVLGHSLVHHFPPKHHIRADKIFNELMESGVNDPAIWLGKGFISQWAGNWADAADAFDKAIELGNDVFSILLVAREGKAWALANRAKTEDGLHMLRTLLSELGDGDKKAKARIQWKIGQVLLKQGADQEEIYKIFVNCLKCDSSFAPAFTSLGMYYFSKDDKLRATKCFQKAFELDAGEVTAAKMLAESFSLEEEWELLAVVSNRLISGEGSNVGQGISLLNNSWAWKALGTVDMVRGSWQSAGQCFQDILRLIPDDCFSWICMGEVYAQTGKWEASMKSLVRARELEPGNWLSVFLLAGVQLQVGLFEDAVQSYKSLLQISSTRAEAGIKQSLANAYHALGKDQRTQGFFHRAERSFLNSLRMALDVIKTNTGFRRIAWKRVADCIFALSQFGRFGEPELMRDTFIAVHDLLQSSFTNSTLFDHLKIKTDTEQGISVEICAKAATLTFFQCLNLSGNDREAQATAAFDLSNSLYSLKHHTDETQMKHACQIQAIYFAKRAVRLNPGDDLAWVLLGDLHRESAPKIAQHAYIQALEINRTSARTWSRLGYLFLKEENLDLAIQAFQEAQVADPSYHLAWVGHGVACQKGGQEKGADLALSFAFGMEGNHEFTDLHYCGRHLQKQSSRLDHDTDANNEHTLLIVEKLLRKENSNPNVLHLKSLLAEKIGLHSVALETIEICSSTLEALYEDSESLEIAWRYCLAQVTCGRLNLSLEQYSESLKAFEMALNLLSESTRQEDQRINIQASFGLGISLARQGSITKSLEVLENVCVLAHNFTPYQENMEIVKAQIAWSIGDLELAQSHLLNSGCLSALPIVITLAALGMASSDQSLIDAALEEILDHQEERNEVLSRDIAVLLSLYYLAKRDLESTIKTVQRHLYSSPGDVVMREKLAALMLWLGCKSISAALSDLGNGEQSSTRLVTIRTVTTGMVGSPTEAFRTAQKSVWLMPWNTDHWTSLTYTNTLL